MRHLFIALCALVLTISFASSAQADGRAFPPDNCSTGSPFMAFTGVDGSNTFCNSGQDIFKNALPSCGTGQVVAYDGSKFYCKAEVNVPTCQSGTFLSFDGTNYTCNGTGVVTCGANQVLTFNGTSYFCVNKDATIPVCAANQFLTYNGSYQCAAVNTPSIPTCAAGQVLTSNGGQLVCVDGNSGGNASCELDHKVTTINGWAKFYSAYHRNKNGQLIDGQDGGNLQLLSTEMKPNGWQGSSTSTNMAYQSPSPYSNPSNNPVDTVDNCIGPGLGMISGGCFTCVNGNWVSGDMGSYPEAPASYPMGQD